MSLDDNKATRPYKIAAILLIILPFILISIARTSGTVVDAETGEIWEKAYDFKDSGDYFSKDISEITW